MTDDGPPPIEELADAVERESMLRDRDGLRRLVSKVRQREKKGQPADRLRTQLTEQLTATRERAERRTKSVPKLDLPPGLPVADHADELAEKIQTNQVVIVCGETGSGKSTQLPKILLRLGRGRRGLIGHTQPRRIAARSLATRISDEVSTKVGEQIGYQVRFADKSGPDTLVKLMTDGILLASTPRDPDLLTYDTLIIDEAHERSLNIDFLLGYIKRLLPRRPDLKLIITSATLDAERFAEHFGDDDGNAAPVVEIPGRMFPVDVQYRPVVDDSGEEKRDGDGDWLRAASDATFDAINQQEGDVLVFLPTERDIRELATMLRGRLSSQIDSNRLELLPLYGRLSVEAQAKVFAPTGKRRVVLATNVAESSLTVPGIRVVIDPGLARISRYAPKSKVQRLPIEAVSKASANQRSGRCGRVGPGVCVRLYSAEDFANREDYTPPEILRTNLASVILQISSLKLGRVDEFPFIDPPKPAAVRAGYQTLYELGGLDEKEALTEIGRQLSRMPVDPRIGRMLIAGRDEGVLGDMLVIAAALEIRDPRDRPQEKQKVADERHERFTVEGSDFLTLLAMWEFVQKLRKDHSRSKFRRALGDNFLSPARVQEWFDVHRQLKELAVEQKWKLKTTASGEEKAERIHRAVLAGMLSNVGLKGDKHSYKGPHDLEFHLWPGSQLFKSKPKWVVSAEMVETTRRYARTSGPIKPEWIEPLAKHLVKVQTFEPHYSTKADAAMVNEKVLLWGLPVVSKRRVKLAKHDPEAAREMFLREGIALGGYRSRGDFQKKNDALLAGLEATQAKTRRANLLLGEDAIVAFFEARLPGDIADGRSFEKWRRKAEKKQPDLLVMTAEDVLADPHAAVDRDAFPDALDVGSVRYPLLYRHDPGKEDDGVTLVLPKEAAGRLDSRRLGWLVPGLLEEKVAGLLKSLPKETRRHLVPIPDTARAMCADLKFGEGDLVEQLSALLRRDHDMHVPVSEFDESRLPGHLSMQVRYAGEGEAAPPESPNGRGKTATASPPDDDPARHERSGLTAWDFDELPAQVTLQRGGLPVVYFPALVDEGDSVAVRMLSDDRAAVRASMRGLTRLYFLQERKRIANQVDHFPKVDRVRLHAIKLRMRPGFDDQMAWLLAESAVFSKRTLPRTKAAWEERIKLAANHLSVAVQDAAEWCGPTMEAASQLMTKLENENRAAFSASVEDVRSQLSMLCAADFIAGTPSGWLGQFPRYLSAIRTRLKKLEGGGLGRDRQMLAKVSPKWGELLDWWTMAPGDHRRPGELDAYRWLLEEWRVRLFDERAGVIGDVSTKALAAAREKAADAMRMV